MAQSVEDQSDSLQALAGADGNAPVANANDEAARLPMRRYSNNRATNERLNAVFHLIATEGNGLVWDGPDEDETPPAVVASVPPKQPAVIDRVAKSVDGEAKRLPAVASRSPTAKPEALSAPAKPVPPILSASSTPNSGQAKPGESSAASANVANPASANSAPMSARASFAAAPAPVAPLPPAEVAAAAAPLAAKTTTGTTAAVPVAAVPASVLPAAAPVAAAAAPVASASATAPTAPVITASVPTVPVAAAPVVRTWEVKPNSTLRETLVDWAREAGWNEPKWKPSDPIAVLDGGDKTTVQGTFVEALQALADAAPQINIYASQTKHEITVSDATTQ